MMNYILKRLLLLIPVLIGISMLVFAMRVMVPGDPVDVMMGGRPSSAEVEQAIRSRYGLDEPIHIQYLVFLRNAVRGDFGRSIRTNAPVITEIRDRLPNTIRLALSSLAFAIILGGTTGVFSAVKKDKIQDLIGMFLSLIGISMPAFWLGLLLMRIFAVRLRWLPSMGSDTLLHLVLPALTLGLIASALISRMVRSCMLDVLSQDYVRTARSKGLSETVVIYKHAFRNALIPIVTVVGVQFGYLLGGAFVIEIVFSYTGMGYAAINAIGYRDYPMIQGIALFMAIIFVGTNLVIDIIYTLLNPKLKYN